mmetsp:Transcript_26033/g.82265  ORF Transcript_26033/g.82265 Transcript_26033/m.82265 type:complete len:217 (+) Transcript_26033:1091-1741(+)
MNHVAGHSSACDAMMPQTSAPATTLPDREALAGSGYSCSSEYSGGPAGATAACGLSGSRGGCGLQAGTGRGSGRGSRSGSFGRGCNGWCCSLGGGGGCRMRGAAGPGAAGLGPGAGFGFGFASLAAGPGRATASQTSSVFLSFCISSANSFWRAPRSSLPSSALLSLWMTSASCLSSAARSTLPNASSGLRRLLGFTALVSSSPSSRTPYLEVSST